MPTETGHGRWVGVGVIIGVGVIVGLGVNVGQAVGVTRGSIDGVVIALMNIVSGSTRYA